jgi:hypothetical protein
MSAQPPAQGATLSAPDPRHFQASRPVSDATQWLWGQHQLSTLSGTDGNQPGITGKRPTARNRSSRTPFKIRISA